MGALVQPLIRQYNDPSPTERTIVQTILVVDDKAGVRTLVREYLEQEGFGVVTAENGRRHRICPAPAMM